MPAIAAFAAALRAAAHRQALTEALLAFDADERQWVAVLWGAGGAFCAGFDLKCAAGRMGERRPSRAARAAPWLSRKEPFIPSWLTTPDTEQFQLQRLARRAQVVVERRER